jgi:hypothetical protein
MESSEPLKPSLQIADGCVFLGSLALPFAADDGIAAGEAGKCFTPNAA